MAVFRFWIPYCYADIKFSGCFCVYKTQRLSYGMYNYNKKKGGGEEENNLLTYNQPLREGSNIWEKVQNLSCLKSFKTQLSKHLGRRGQSRSFQIWNVKRHIKTNVSRSGFKYPGKVEMDLVFSICFKIRARGQRAETQAPQSSGSQI